MKIIARCICILFVISTISPAQIPNNGFENWTAQTNCMLPNGWWCSNDSMNQMDTYFPVTRSMDHYPMSVGNYCMRLENQTSMMNWSARGMAWTGNWYGNNYPVFPVLGHPIAMYGYYKYFPQNFDTLDILIRLYKNGIDIAGGSFQSGISTPAWTSFSIPISNYVDADSARILIAAWNVDQFGFNPQGNSVLYVDNLSLDSLILPGVFAIGEAHQLDVYPNPASNEITIYPVRNIGLHNELVLFNNLGQAVFGKEIINMGEIKLDLSQYPEGMYYLRLTTSDQVVFGNKIIITK